MLRWTSLRDYSFQRYGFHTYCLASANGYCTVLPYGRCYGTKPFPVPERLAIIGLHQPEYAEIRPHHVVGELRSAYLAAVRAFIG